MAVVVCAVAGSGCVDRAVGLTGGVSGALQSTLGAPLAGGTIRLSGSVEAATVSDASGAFRFAEVPVGHYVISAALDHTLEGIATSPIEITGAPDPSPILLRLTGVGKASGTVLLAGNTNAAGTRILVGGSPKTTITDATGQFTVDGLAEGDNALFAVHDGWGPAPLGIATIARSSIATTATTTLTQDTLATTTLTGAAFVTDQTDRSGIVVTVDGTTLSATTNADGTFTIADVPLGVVALSLVRGEYSTHIPLLLVIDAGPAIVLGKETFALPPIELSLGQWFAAPPTTGSYIESADHARLYWLDGNRYVNGDVAVVAYDNTKGTLTRLDGAQQIVALHPDGVQVLALKASGPPTSQTELVAWNPLTGVTTSLAANVSSALLLDRRGDVLVTAPEVRLVHLDGRPSVMLTPLGASEEVHVSTSQSTITVAKYYGGAGRWIDLDTGAAIYTSNSKEGVTLAIGLDALLVYAAYTGAPDATFRLLRRGKPTTTLAPSYPQNWWISPQGRFVGWQANDGKRIVDLTTLATLPAIDPASASTVMTPDERKIIAVADRGSDGADVYVIDIASGNVSAPYRVPTTFYPQNLQFVNAADGTTRDAFLAEITGEHVGDLHRIRLVDGSGSVLTTNANQYVTVVGDILHYMLRSSPDGKPHGAAIDLSTGKRTALAYTGVLGGVSPDGSMLTAFDGGRTYLVDIATNAQRTIFADAYYLGQWNARAQWRSDGALYVERFVYRYGNDGVPPAANLGEGLYLAHPSFSDGQ